MASAKEKRKIEQGKGDWHCWGQDNGAGCSDMIRVVKGSSH